MFNNRELAILIWSGAAFVLLVVWKPGREGIASMVKFIATSKLKWVVAAAAIYVAAMITSLHRLSALGVNQAFATGAWVFGAGVATLSKFESAVDRPRFFREQMLANFQIAVLIESVAGVYAFPLAIELALVPFATVLAVLAVVASMKPEHAQVKRYLDALTVLIGFVVLGFVLIQAVVDPRGAFSADTLRDFSVPVLLSIGFLPFVYALGLYSRYEQAFLFMDDDEARPRGRKLRAKAVLVKRYGLRPRRLKNFGHYWQHQLVDAPTWSDGVTVVEAFDADQDRRRHDAEEAKRVEATYQRQLVENVGRKGVDADGQQLDRREFRETAEALDYLSNCQMGWYNNQGKHYHSDLIEKFSDDFTSQGLPQPSGIKMKIAKDGQAWLAWRKTPSGWCFAIGADGPPPRKWKYDGPKPPRNFPGQDEGWGDRPFDDSRSVNW